MVNSTFLFMKVLFVSEYYLPKSMGGGEINLSLLAKALAKNGVEVNILTSFHKGLKKFEQVNGVNIYRRLATGDSPSGIINNFKRSCIFPLSLKKQLRRLAQEIEFDLIHFIGTSVIVSKYANALGKPLFATIESYPSLCPKGDRIYMGKGECKHVCSLGRFMKCQSKCSEIGKTKNTFFMKYNVPLLIYVYLFYKRMNTSLKYCRLIAISEYIKGLLKQHGQNSVVIPNVIDVIKFNINNTRKNKKHSTKPRILYLGSLTKYKGPHILLDAIKGLDVRCDLYGEGAMKQELQRIIDENNLNAEIHNNVPYEEVPQIYANSDIVVFPSIWPEPFGRIAIEAMAAGKIVIGSDIGGIKETLLDSISLVLPGDVVQLREAIRAAISKNKFIAGDTNKYSENTILNKLIKRYDHSLC
jgi:glycosyltransferase involved in cell wall biosynthesis